MILDFDISIYHSNFIFESIYAVLFFKMTHILISILKKKHIFLVNGKLVSLSVNRILP